MNENTNLFHLDFNVTGEERKRLVRAISEYTGADSHYLGVPSCAFQVDYFTISKDGCVSFDDRADSEEIEGLIETLAQQGFVSQSSNLGCEAEPEATEAATLEGNGSEGSNPSERAGADTEADVPSEGESADEDTDEPEDGPFDEDEDEEEDLGMTACLPMEGLDDWALENLRKLVSAKGALIRKALSADRLDINVGEGGLEFPWWDTMPEQDEVPAYLDFITALSRMAREAKRVTAREKDVENEKYAFRCFLIRLGFVGNDYKAQRKILLRNLSGSSAFSSKEKAEAFSQVQKARRDAARAEAAAGTDTGGETVTEAGEG